jgi:hypothetical protein
MAAYDTEKMILNVRSILWDLGIPQEAATVMHEENDACTAMGNAQNPSLERDIWILNTFSYVIGSNGI